MLSIALTPSQGPSKGRLARSAHLRRSRDVITREQAEIVPIATIRVTKLCPAGQQASDFRRVLTTLKRCENVDIRPGAASRVDLQRS